MERNVAFVVRVTIGGKTALSGTIERVRTGEKHRFKGLDALGPLIAQMVESAARDPRVPPEDRA